MLKLTDNAKQASRRLTVKPNLVFSIEGYDEVFSAANVFRLIRIGDPGLRIGNTWRIGGITFLEGASPYVAFNNGGNTTARITQQLALDRAQGSSATTLMVSVVDKGEILSRLISPGFDLTEILAANAVVKIGFVDTAYPQDYVTVFRGFIQDVDSSPGMVHFKLVSPEGKKNAPSFAPRTWPLLTQILAADALTTIGVNNPSLFATPVLGPDGEYDSSIEYYAKINDEIFKYTGVGANTLTGVSRAQFGTLADDHDVEDEISSVYRLRGNGIQLALKILLSGWNGPFVENIPITAVNAVPPATFYTDMLFFSGVDLEDEHGITVGDWATISGSAESANNQTLQIAVIEKIDDGTLVGFNGAGLVNELTTTAVVSFRSQYDTLGQGLRLKPNEVDVAEFQHLHDVFLSAYQFDFVIEEIPNTKQWIEQELLLPMACFSIPRKGRTSIGLTIGPIAGDSVVVLDSSNVTNAAKLKISRSLATNFANTIRYKYDYSVADRKFLTSKKFESEKSLARLSVGENAIEIEARGLKTSLDATSIAQNGANKLLYRYQFGAQFIKGVQCQFAEGFPVEIGDVVIVDMASLKMTDIETGNRSGGRKLFEVINKSLDIKTGEVTLDLISTSFLLEDRFATIAPSSEVGEGATTTRIPLKKSFGTQDYQKESRKWTPYIGEKIVIHSENWTTYYAETTIINVDRLSSPEALIVQPLPTAPLENYVVECPPYPDSDDAEENENWKSRHAFLSPTVNVVSGISQAKFEVAPTDLSKFKVGAIVRVHSENFSDDAEEAKVIAVNDDNTIEIDTETGFTITSAHRVDLIGFKDGGAPYRWL